MLPLDSPWDFKGVPNAGLLRLSLATCCVNTRYSFQGHMHMT